MSNLSLRMKILAGFTVVMLLTVVLGIIAFVEVQGLGRSIDDFASNLVPSITYLNDIEKNVNDIRRGEIQASYKPDDSAAVAKYHKRLYDKKDEIAKNIAGYDKMSQTPEERTKWSETKQRIDQYFVAAAKTFELITEGKHEEAKAQQNVASKKQFDDGISAVGKLIDYNSKEAFDNGAQSGHRPDDGTHDNPSHPAAVARGGQGRSRRPERPPRAGRDG